jgi:hypothetical protein
MSKLFSETNVELQLVGSAVTSAYVSADMNVLSLCSLYSEVIRLIELHVLL